jgi:cbb3-type cytochrome c oxidase subunit III
MMHTRTRLGLVVAAFALLLGGDEAAAQGKAAAPAGVTSAAIAKGDSIYHKDGLCYACHGSNAEGAVGPNLTDAEWLHGDGSYDMIVATVTSGVPADKAKKGIPMPPKGGSSITEEQVKAVAAYVYSLSHK